MAGHIYAVCRDGDEDNTKCGFSCQEIWKYIAANYGKTMFPLKIRKVMWVPDAKLAEDILFVIINERRKTERHEIFDLDDAYLLESFDILRDTIKTMTRNQIHPYFVQPPETETVGRVNQVQRSINQLKKEQAAERKQNSVAQYEQKMAQEKQAEKVLSSHIKAFVDKHRSQNDKVFSVDLHKAFLKELSGNCSIIKFNEHLAKNGFVKKDIRIGKKSTKGFEGLCLND